jgi:tetratricopeptide (TPR) repeat protein
MKRLKLVIPILIISLMFLTAADSPDTKLFREARLEVLEKNWREALVTLSRLEKKFPQSKHITTGYFYRGKCLEELNRQEDAIKASGKSESLREEAMVSIINSSFALHKRGKNRYMGRIYSALNDSNFTVIRYYAALKLSYSKDKAISKKSIPVLIEIMEEEKDNELRDRAKIAILRVDPAVLNKMKTYEKYASKTLRISIYSKGRKEATSTIRIPLALADIGLKAISERDQNIFRKQGFDIAEILYRLSKKNKEVITIETEEGLIKVWVEE